MDKKVKYYIEEFMNEYQDYFFDSNNSLYDSARIYNEISLQHELGFFLREKLGNQGYRIDFERHEKNLNIQKENIKRDLKKHEIDIIVYDKSNKMIAIELKYPRKRNIAYNINLYAFYKDIEFMEQMREAGFAEAYSLVVSDDPYVYKNKTNKKNIYDYFRTYGLEEKDIPVLINSIDRKDKTKKTTYYVDGLYKIIWHPIKENKHIMYYILEADNVNK